MPNSTLMYRSIPHGLPVPGKDLVVEDIPVPDGDGVLVRILLASLDPHMRGQLRDPSISTYEPALPLGQPLFTSVVGTVVRSTSDRLPEGETVWLARAPLAQYTLIPASVTESQRMVVPIGHLVRELNIDAGHWLGILGVPGLTGFAGLYECGHPKAGETIFISSAAGTVGLTVAYFCKRDGLRVVGSAGSAKKVDFLRGTGLFDDVFDHLHEDETCAAALRRVAPQGLDIHFANVGGSQLQAAVACMNVHGRVVLCNAIDEYDADGPASNASWLWQPVVYRRIVIRGFLVTDLASKHFVCFQEQMYEAIKKHDLAKIAALHVVDGIDNAAQALADLFHSGRIMGKLLVRVSTDPGVSTV